MVLASHRDANTVTVTPGGKAQPLSMAFQLVRDVTCVSCDCYHCRPGHFLCTDQVSVLL